MEDKMAKCWEQRGCDEEMQGECPHAVEYFDNCPTKCAFATCDRPTYELTIDPALIFSPEVDRSQAIKDGCTYCAFFLQNGPRVEVK
jgi:hypothetical protein